MNSSITNNYGTISYNESTLANVAGLIAMECYGIVGMSSKKVTDGIVELLNINNFDKGIKVTINDNTLTLQLYIVVEYGVSLATVANNVIDTVKYKLELLTGLNVDKVNVTVCDIRV